MAEMAKTLHFKNSGVEQIAKAYSTVAEAGDKYTSVKIDGIYSYVP